MSSEWSQPIPTKLHPNDAKWLDLLVKRTGLKRADIIRRAIRVLIAEAQLRPEWNWVQETANPLPLLTRQLEIELNQAPPKDFAEANDRAKRQAEGERRQSSRQRTRS